MIVTLLTSSFIILLDPCSLLSIYCVAELTNTTEDAISTQILQERLSLVRLVCTTVLIPVVGVVGITSNLLNICVLASPRMRTSTNTYLLTLAVFDLMNGFTFILLALRTNPRLEASYTYMSGLPYFMAFGNLCHHTASWLTCAFTVERYIAISSPMLARKICTQKRSRWIIFGLCIFTFAITIPDLYAYRIKLSCPVAMLTGNTTMFFPTDAALCPGEMTNPTYLLERTTFSKKLHHNGWAFFISTLAVLLPLTLLSIFNGLLIRSVIRASRQRVYLRTNVNHTSPSSHHGRSSIGTHSGSSRSLRQSVQVSLKDTNDEKSMSNLTQGEKLHLNGCQVVPSLSRKRRVGRLARSFRNSRHTQNPQISENQRITVMLILLVLFFCIFNIPSAIWLLCMELQQQRKSMAVRLKFSIAGNFTNLGLAISSALNFFLYSWLSRRFRRTFYSLFNCRQKFR